MEKYNLIPVKRKKGSIIYDIYAWNEGLIPSQKIQHKSNKKIKKLSYMCNFMLTVPRLSLATIVSLIARGLGDSALVEMHFQKKNVNL
jgi:hypothetical protein